MMNKRNLILGLLVFMAGIFMVACGGEKGATDTTTTKVPDEWKDAKCKECTRTYKGTFRITDDGLFLQAIGVDRANDLGWGNTNTFWGQILNAFSNDVISPGTNLVYCVGAGVILEGLANALKTDDSSIECSSDDMDIFENKDDDRVKSSYKGTLKVAYKDYEAEEIELFVDSNIEKEDFRDVFYYEGINEFENSEGTLTVVNNSGRVRLISKSGRVIGEFRN